MNQHQLILQYLENNGSITPMEAFRELGITKLSTRIGELSRMGYQFDRVMETSLNRNGHECRFMRYRKAAA